MCSIDDSSSSETAPASSPQRLVITLCPEIAANVSGRTNSSAALVITTWGSYPASCKRRTSSTDLYAAIPPQTPTVTFTRPSLIPFPSNGMVSHASIFEHFDYRSRPTEDDSFPSSVMQIAPDEAYR